MQARWLVGLLVGVLGVGCKRDAPAPRTPVSPAPRPAAPPVAAPAPPPAVTSPRELDALWALAPEGTTLGVVVSPRGLALIERGWVAIQDMLASTPDFAAINSQLLRALQSRVGTMTPTLAGFGLSHDKSAALFWTDTDQLVLVIPIRDRDKFLALVHGSKGGEVDQLDGGACKMIGAHYVCVQDRELLARLGQGGLDATRRTAGARGDVEIAARAPDPGGPSIAVAAELDRGTVVLRGAITGAPPDIVDKLGAPTPPRAGSATAAAFGVLDATHFLPLVPKLRVLPRVTLVDLARTVAGPITYAIPAGTSDLGIRIPLGDTTRAQDVVEHCTDVPGFAQAGVAVQDGTCRLANGLAAWIEGGELHIGERAPATPTALPASRLASEIAQGAWSAAFFGRGAVVGLPALAAARLPGAEPMLRVLPLVNEIGFALRRDGDALHFVFGLRTAWTNPDDIVKKLLALTVQDLQSDKATQVAAAIVRAAPNSPFAHDVRVGVWSWVGISAAAGAVAGIAIPALIDGIERAKRPEVLARLDHITRAARSAWLATGAFPKGEVALTPAASCCRGVGAHCVTPASEWQHPIWKTLGFKIEKPHLFRYSYKSDGKTMTATAVGDLDCDGTEITYELRGEGSVVPKFTLVPPANAD